MQRMLNKDFTRSIHAESFSRAPKERLCWQDVREYVTSNYLLNLRKLFISLPGQCCQENQAPGVALRLVRDWSKSIGGVGRSREGVGHEVLSLVQGVGRAIFSYP